MSKENGLTSNQRDILKRIVEYGEQHKVSHGLIEIAIKAACIESTLGTKMKNDKPGSTAEGLYSYTDVDWHQYHRKLGEKNNTDHQIVAFYTDLQRYAERFEKLPEHKKELSELERKSFGDKDGHLTFDEYVYLCHYAGENYLNKHGFDERRDLDALKYWHNGDGAKFYNPDWIDEIHFLNPAASELSEQQLAEIAPETVINLIESGMDNGLSMEVIAERLTDLYLPQSVVMLAGNTDVAAAPDTLDRQMLFDAWSQLLKDAGEDPWMQIETVSQSGNRIEVEFEDDSTVTLIHLSSRMEVNHVDIIGDPISNHWWNADGSYGAITYDIDGSSSSTRYNLDGSYSTYENDGYDAIVMNTYAADGSYSNYTDDGFGDISLNNYAADGSYSSYTDDGFGNTVWDNYAADGTLVDDGGFVTDNNDYTDPDGSIYTTSSDDQSGNIYSGYDTDDQRSS